MTIGVSNMLSKYEIENVILAEQYTKSRKILTLNSLEPTTEKEKELIQQVKEKILKDKSEKDVLDHLESEETEYWINYFGNRAAADLISLGKVQPETMLAMSRLSEKDFTEAVKIATKSARRINNIVIEAEAELNMNLIPEELI